MVTIAVFLCNIFFLRNEHIIKQHVKLKINNFPLIIIYHFICHSIACIYKLPLKKKHMQIHWENFPSEKLNFSRYHFTF